MTSKNYFVIKRLYVPVYNLTIHIIKTDKFNEYIKDYNLKHCIKNLKNDDLNLTSNGLSFQNGLKNYYILVKKYASVSVMAHEAVHTIDRIFFDMGQYSDFVNDEIYAYHVGWITEEIFNMFQ